MTNRLTPEQLAQIRERAEKATEGPWYTGNGYEQSIRGNYVAAENTGAIVCAEQDGTDCVLSTKDATFIAQAREDIPNLLAHIEKQAEEIRYYKGYADRYSEVIAEQKAEIDRLRKIEETVTKPIDIEGIAEDGTIVKLKNVVFDYGEVIADD